MNGKRKSTGSAARKPAARKPARKPASSTSRKPASRRPKTKKRRPRGKKRWGLRIFLTLMLLGLTGAVLGVLAFVYLYTNTGIPDPNKDFETQTSFVYYSDGQTQIGKFATQNRVSIPLEQMPQDMKDAVVAAENKTFWTDRGIDPKGIVRAAFSNARGNATQGASTITQQYVKVLYLTQERSLERKVKEAILSLKIQNQRTKKQILEGYLNTIYYGRGAYGVEAAAQAYFDIPAANLNLRQCAVLASVLNNPTGLDPDNGKAEKRALKERYHYVLKAMAQEGMISDAEAAQAAKRLPPFPEIKAQSQYGEQRGHMLKLVRDELHRLGYSDSEIDGEGLRVTTTFTPEAMLAAEDGVKEARPDGFSDKELHIAVASVEPGTGALVGFYGGQDYLDSQINWSVAGGMVGSTFKPISLTTALEAGFSLKDSFDGMSPYVFPDGLEVRNEGQGRDGNGNDYGPHVSAVQALEESINTAFVDMSNSIPNGPERILETANEIGIPPAEADPRFPGIPSTSRDLEADALITLGKARLSPINMANAYATIANGGERADVHVINKVVNRNGETLYSFRQSTRPVVDPDIAADVSYAMQQVVKNGTGRGALALGRPAAGKTGTATNDKDEVSSAWFVGFTPQLSTAVMYVRGDGDNQLDGWLPSYFGADYPTDTWTAVMSAELDGLPVEQFPPPAFVDGEAPADGHAPWKPPKPKPTKTPTKSPSATATDSATGTPTGSVSTTPCPGNSNCPTDTATATVSPTATTSTTPAPTPAPAVSGSAGPSGVATTMLVSSWWRLLWSPWVAWW